MHAFSIHGKSGSGVPTRGVLKQRVDTFTHLNAFLLSGTTLFEDGYTTVTDPGKDSKGNQVRTPTGHLLNTCTGDIIPMEYHWGAKSLNMDRGPNHGAQIITG